MPAFDPTSGDPPRQQKDLLPEDLPVYQAWFTTLFDKKSEGIEDNIFRSTRILVLLRIAPVLIIEAIDAYEKKIMEKEVLDNGVAYFLGPLLNWTLVGVIRALVLQMQQTGYVLDHTFSSGQSLCVSDVLAGSSLNISKPYASW
jgi:mediator of RNA polymerase II transcription subunit 5